MNLEKTLSNKKHDKNMNYLFENNEEKWKLKYLIQEEKTKIIENKLKDMKKLIKRVALEGKINLKQEESINVIL